MEKQILCEECHKELKRIAGKYKHEGFRSVRGKSRDNYFCDGCIDAHFLPVGSIVYADTLWLPGRQDPEEGWEEEFVEVEK
ncbi:MAG: hypothetical protein A4E65_03100 [Syntrophorhabdus sp. PtaU1.Bin153]|nr:MAG: hypothetical protein A4E65_03100 [Syntrophorhabdus sp. PtaU1.Bin153]